MLACVNIPKKNPYLNLITQDYLYYTQKYCNIDGKTYILSKIIAKFVKFPLILVKNTAPTCTLSFCLTFPVSK